MLQSGVRREIPQSNPSGSAHRRQQRVAPGLGCTRAGHSGSEVQFQRAVQLETIEGNLNAAIDLYKQVIKNNGKNRALAARALLRLGGCYERQGNAEASKAYEVLLRDYADQADLAVEARTRLSALRKPAAQSLDVDAEIWPNPRQTSSVRYLRRQIPVVRRLGDRRLAVRNLAEEPTAD